MYRSCRDLVNVVDCRVSDAMGVVGLMMIQGQMHIQDLVGLEF